MKNIARMSACSISIMVVAGCAALPSPVADNSNLPPRFLADPAPASGGPDFHPEGQGWELVWSDEFDSSALDTAKWEIELSCWGGGNEERQCYTDQPHNVRLTNGLLELAAYPETHTGPLYPQGWPEPQGENKTQSYTSGKVRTRERASWTYGRIEARMKLPAGQGTWPAFWMLPEDSVYGTWPLSGEIDIMEAVNIGEVCETCAHDEGENRSSGALHFGDPWPDNEYIVQWNEIPGAPGAANDYHVYAVEWGQGRISWFVDDDLYFTATPEDWFTAAVDAQDNPYAPFDQDFYLMFNLAVGGGLSEDNNATGFDPDSFPARLLVDWVRVYQCAPDRETGLACMQTP